MCAVLAAGALFAVAGGGATLSLCDYVSPETSLSHMSLSFAYRYYEGAFGTDTDVNAGKLRLDYGDLRDTGDFGYTLEAFGELSLQNLRIASGLGDARGTLRFYLEGERPLFAFGGAHLYMETGDASPGLQVNVGLGYGRFSDVTPLARAMRIEKMLLSRGSLKVPLSESVLMAMAKEIGRGAEYATVAELVDVLVKSVQNAAGVLLDPRVVLAVEDQVLVAGARRYCGWAAQIGIGYTVADPLDGPRDFLVTGEFDMALAPEEASQILLRARLSGPIDIFNTHRLGLSVSYENALGPASALNARLSATRVQVAGAEARTSLSASFGWSVTVGMTALSVQLTLAYPAGAVRVSKDISVSVVMALQ